jgi:hypothetical protein
MSYLSFFFVCFVLLQCWGLNSGPIPWTTPPALFCDRVWGTVCPGWLQTSILLISASWVAGITGVSHLHQAKCVLKSSSNSCNILLGHLKLQDASCQKQIPGLRIDTRKVRPFQNTPSPGIPRSPLRALFRDPYMQPQPLTSLPNHLSPPKKQRKESE